MKISCISLKVEVDAGSGIEDACKDAVELATKLGVCVWFGFNGVTCLARPNDDSQRIAAAYHREQLSKEPYKLASSN